MKKYINLLIITLSIFLYPQYKPKLLWFDATANFARLSNQDSIRYYLSLAKQTGFTDVVVDVKPITGEVLFPSAAAPQMKEWAGFRRSDSLDFLNFFIDQSHLLGLRVHASLNIFVAGHNFFDRGLVYQNKSDWQSINYTDTGFVPITKLKHLYSAMTNPVLWRVQQHELEVLRELTAKYKNLDGLILDRVRYDCIQADFSDSSRAAFENYIGKKVKHFPADIYEWKREAKEQVIRKDGPLFTKWLEWRASVIYNFIVKAKTEVKSINPNISFGDYTGAWYPLYYEVGVNWASREYDPSRQYSWATPAYKNFAYAELLDLYTTGCYFYEVTKDEVERLNEKQIQRGEAAMGKGKEYWYSVEGSAEIAKEVTMNKTGVLGGLYVEQYKGHPDQYIRAVKMCLEKTDGLMIFDIVHLINNGWWNVMREALGTTVNLNPQWIRCADRLNFPEGPSYSGDELYFSNCYGGWIGRLKGEKTDTLVSSATHPDIIEKTNGTVIDKDGSLYVCEYGKGRILKINKDKRVEIVAPLNDEFKLNRPNDITLDKQGNIFFTDPKSYNRDTLNGRIFKIEKETGRLTLVYSGLAFPNGIAISNDGTKLFVCESAKSRVVYFELKDCSPVGEPHEFVVLPGGDPDGIDFDCEGNLYVAHFGGKAVYVVSPRGHILYKIETPGKKPSNVEFGGELFKTLYITEDETNAVYKITAPTSGRAR